jgi:periplasmic divalent cation tolerance protein
MPNAIQVITTTATRDEADAIARTLVDERLAACVQVTGPVTSTYRWQGAIESGQEWLCVIKTLRSHFELVERAIRQRHSYEVPEIVAFEIVAGNADYLAWLAGEVSDLGGERTV